MATVNTGRKGILNSADTPVPYEIRKIDDSQGAPATKLRSYRNAVVAAAERGDEGTVKLARKRQLDLLKKEFDSTMQRRDSKNLDSALEILSQMELLERLLFSPEAARKNKEERLIALNKKDSYLRSERVKKSRMGNLRGAQEETQA